MSTSVPRPSDGPGLAAISPDVEGSAISFEEAPTSAEMSERVRVTLLMHPFLGCEDADAVIAYAGVIVWCRRV